MSSRGVRVGRGVAAASVATLLAGLSHTIGGGAVPLGPGAALAYAFAVLLCIGLAGRRFSTLRLGASVVVSQLAYHALFAVTGGSSAASAGSAHHLSATAMSADLAHIMPTMTGGDSAMWIAHAAAAALTILALRRGELAVRAIAGVVIAVVRTLSFQLPRVVPVVVGRLRASVIRVVSHDAEVLLSSMRHRGPPVAGAFA